MTDLLPSWCRDFWFYSMTALDFLLVSSLLFSALYSLFLCVAFCFPRPAMSRRHTGITIFLCGTAVALMFTDVGDWAAGTASGALNAILFFLAESWLPDIPMLFWVAGSILSLLFLAREFAGLRRLAAESETIADNPAFEKACAELGMRGAILLKTPTPNRPAASWGVFTRRVFVPEDFASAYSDEEQYYIFLHELTHIRRLDTVKYLCVCMVKALFWFHPIVLLSIRNIRDAIEVACDWETVTRHDVRHLCYARLIIKAHTNVSCSIPGFSHGANTIKRRIGHITNHPEWIRTRLRTLLLPVLMAAAALFVVFTGRFTHQEPPLSPVLVDHPHGGKIRITNRFYWRGAVGVYSTSDAVAVDPLAAL